MSPTSSASKRQAMFVVAWAPLFTKLAVGCAASATGGMPEPTGAGGDSGGAASSAGSMSTAGAPATSGASSSSGAANAGSGAGGAAAGGAHGGAGGAPPAGGGTSTGTGGKCNSTGPAGESFFDGFEDGEYTACPGWIDADPSLGGMWSVKADGATKVLAQGGAISDWVIAVSGNYKVTDQTVQAKVKFTSSPGAIGIFARVQDVRNYYTLYLDGSNIVLRGRVDNSQLTSVKVKSPTVEGTWYTLKLSVIGSTLTGYLDGVQLVTTMDASVKSGGIGVGTSDSATAEFDDVTVTTP